MTYASRTVGVVADLDGATGDDGTDTDGDLDADEGDTIDMTVESHTGGAANDRFDGNALPNTLKGGAGNDRLVGATATTPLTAASAPT